jgi:AcrR family transcriptional regulator
MTDVFAAPRALPPAGERILAVAEPLFYERGIRAVGVDAIADAAGTTKKTLYDRFGSKDALVAAYLVRRARKWQAHLGGCCDELRPGRDRALGVFDAAGTWHAGSARGCAFINAYAEYGGIAPHPVVEIVRAEKDWMRQYFVDTLAAGRVRHPKRTGNALHLLYEGALVTLTAGADPAALGAARRAASTLLEQA